MNRTAIADHIVDTLELESGRLSLMYDASREKIGHFIVDDLPPPDIAKQVYRCFPAAEDMRLKKSMREYKYIAAQMDNYEPILEEAIYAFQDPRVVELIANICRITTLYADEHLYAGGISLMTDKQFLNPHIDNPHDKDRDKWRVLNLLYYVTPDWPIACGGNLELWPDGLQQAPVLVHSKFNRLAVMSTHNTSWHSVSPISHAGSSRCCVSNYYFSDSPLKLSDEFHVTSFRGRPGQTLRNVVLQADAGLRMLIRKLRKKGIVDNKHVYKK